MKKAFTIIELMIVVSIMWVWLIWVFTMANNSYKFLSDVKSKLVAINIARWGVEWIFDMRNTNWQRWWWKKDQCWLKINPLVDDSDNGCENDTWFQSGSYILSLTWISQKYFSLKVQSPALQLNWPIKTTDWNYLLCKQNGIISSCSPTVSSRPANYFSPILYFQQVRGWYLLDKNAPSNSLNCSEWDDTNCWDGRFLEKNFCVDVVYFNGAKKHVTFCSVMTNFQE